MSAGYKARLHRIGRWWAVDIPELSIHTQCRTLDEAEDMARDTIAEALGIRRDTITVELVVPEFASLLQSVLEARRRRAAADAAEQQTLADAARTLVKDLCVSQGDACRLLGISHQEVSHLSPAHGSGDTRPWRHGPLSTPGAPGLGIRSSGDTAEHSSGQQRPRPELANGSPDSSMMRPGRARQASARRPSWAIAEDDG
ncbi:type II toxin-antitoxin system HicB family antitoxin [Streptomyces sp. NPDC002870]|uniref:type II toxin-antitoxin system HicB family antitoxin n=1 Tax=Streptomyces sp. NPDC002870 TaxID=3364666 RepID=UPI00369E505B